MRQPERWCSSCGLYPATMYCQVLQWVLLKDWCSWRCGCTAHHPLRGQNLCCLCGLSQRTVPSAAADHLAVGVVRSSVLPQAPLPLGAPPLGPPPPGQTFSSPVSASGNSLRRSTVCNQGRANTSVVAPFAMHPAPRRGKKAFFVVRSSPLPPFDRSRPLRKWRLPFRFVGSHGCVRLRGHSLVNIFELPLSP